jgi:hypothetical protein
MLKLAFRVRLVLSQPIRLEPAFDIPDAVEGTFEGSPWEQSRRIESKAIAAEPVSTEVK